MSVGMRDSFNSARVGNGGESGRRSVPALGPAAIAAVSRARLHFPVGRALRSVLTSSGSPFPAGARVGRPSPSRDVDPEQRTEMIVERAGALASHSDARLQGLRHRIAKPGRARGFREGPEEIEALGTGRTFGPASVERVARLRSG